MFHQRLYSLAKWEYSVPFVNRFQIFEMPVLGLPAATTTGFFSHPATFTGGRPVTFEHRQADITHMPRVADLRVTEAVADIDGAVGILADIAMIELLGYTTQLHLATEIDEAVQPGQYAKGVR